MTKQQELISQKNNQALRKKLGLTDSNMVLHHVDKTLRHTDVERYIQWNEEDVVIMTRGEHTKLHYDDIFTPETRKKIGWKTGTGKPKPEPKQHSDEEWRKKISEGRKNHLANKDNRLYGEKNGRYGKGYLTAGEKNGMYGKQSPNKGKHWKTIDGKRVYFD